MDPYYSLPLPMVQKFSVNDIGSDVFKIGISAGPEATELVIKRSFFHGSMPLLPTTALRINEGVN